MATPALTRLASRHGCPLVDAEAARSFLAEQPDALSVLFFTGDPNRRPESTDVAVVLGELLQEHSGRLRAAIVDRDAEEDLKAVYGVMVVPSLVFLRREGFLGVIPKIKDWSDYAEAVDTYLQDGSAPTPIRH